MKKLMLAELAVLALLLIGAAVFLLTGLSQPAFAPDTGDDPALSDQPGDTGDTTEAPEQTTTAFVPTWKTYPETRQLLAQQYFVYDCKAGTFLKLSGTADERIWPASVTKLFTAYAAMQYLQPGTEITAGAELDMVAWGSSVAKLPTGAAPTVM